MPKSTRKTITVMGTKRIGSSVPKVCDPASYTTSQGRSWTGSQRRKKKKFNPPTAIFSVEYHPNTEIVLWNPILCPRPAFSPYGPGHNVGAPPSKDALRNVRKLALTRFGNNTGLGITILESNKSYSMIVNRVRQLSSIIKHARRGNFRSAADALFNYTNFKTSNKALKRLRPLQKPSVSAKKRAAGFWLESQFGWSTLFQSIYDSATALFEQNPSVRSASAKDKQVSQNPYLGGDSYSVARSGVYAEIKNQRLAQLDGLGLANPLELIWDKIPYSFVVDWFIPISAMLRYAGVRRYTGTLYSWESETYNVKTYGTGTSPPTLVVEKHHYQRTPIVIGARDFITAQSSSLWQAITAVSLFMRNA